MSAPIAGALSTFLAPVISVVVGGVIATGVSFGLNTTLTSAPPNPKQDYIVYGTNQ